MEITLTKLGVDHPTHIEATVRFRDDINSPHNGCTVTVFIERDNSQTLSEIQNNAISAARIFMSKAAISNL